ncbi:MAG: hypothetical protein ABIQ81_02615 [Novosphingobium sp.]
MYGSNWRVLATFAGLALLFVTFGFGLMLGASGNPQYRNQQSISSELGGGESYHGPSDSLPDIAGLPGQVERAIANPRPTHGEDNDKRDLAAQEASALWAFWMVCTAIATFVVTTIGTRLIYQQVTLTREAVDDTAKATRAMERQNDIAAAAQRAWVTIGITPKFWESDAHGGIRYRMDLVFKNTGQSAAENFNVFAKLEFRGPDFGESMTLWQKGITALFDKCEHVLPPGGQDTVPCAGGMSKGHVPWFEQVDDTQTVHPVITAVALYTLEGRPDHILSMTRTFFIGKVDARRWVECFMREPCSLGPDEIVATPYRSMLVENPEQGGGA